MLVPFERNATFVGRELEIAELEEKLASDNDCPRVALYGLGGVGKTQIVLEYAYRRRERFPSCAIFWLPATSRESFEHAYMQIGDLLQIHEIGDNANVRQLVKKRLGEQNSEHWLLIIDNADTTDSTSLDMLHDLPSSSRGSIIFTTRTRNNAMRHARTNVMEVREMNQDGARRILENSLVRKVPPSESAASTELLALLVNLPLAIVQAAVYMNENDISILQYLRLYKEGEDNMIRILGEEFEDSGRYMDVQNPIAKTWLISFESIQASDKLAADYLSFMACIVQENIPESLLPLRSSISTLEAIGTLLAYSFIRRREGEGKEARFYNMHRLVHLATRGWLKENNQLSNWTEEALMRLITLIPRGGHENREVWTAYIPHAIYVSHSADISSDNEQSRIDLLDRIGHCQASIGRYSVAVETYRRVLKLREKILGEEHPETLASMNNLAQALSSQGKYAEAETMHRKTLLLKEKVLGREHPQTLTSINNLGAVFTIQGKYAEAETIHRKTLSLSEKILGKEHPDTLLSMNNLAQALSIQGKYTEAEAMHRETLFLKEKILGKEHPDTLVSMNNLSVIFFNQGKHAVGEAMHRETLSLNEKVLGNEHPDTLVSMNNLANVLSSQGKLDEAEHMYQQALRGYESSLGPDHISTLHTIGNLGSLYADQGKLDEAEHMYQQALRGYESSLGPDHISTLHTIGNLGSLYANQGKLDEAEHMYQQALRGYESSLGPDHISTLHTIGNLGSLYADQGKLDEAEHMYQQALRGYESSLGPDHISTLDTIGNLGSLYANQGKLDEAEHMYQRALRGYERALGPDHPKSVVLKQSIKLLYSSSGM